MNQTDCAVICDLLPLYIDHACSEYTRTLVESHLETCPNCQALYQEMISDLDPELRKSHSEKNTLFHHVRKHICKINIQIALILTVFCFAINVGAAWWGGKADIGHLATTLLYLLVWFAFTYLSRNFRPMIRLSFVMSLLTFISSMISLRAIIFGAGFISAFLSVFASVPFYGLRFFMKWKSVYITTTLLSLCWLIYTSIIKHRLKRS